MAEQLSRTYSILVMGDTIRDLVTYKLKPSEESKCLTEVADLPKKKNENIDLHPKFDAILCAGGALQQAYQIWEAMEFFSSRNHEKISYRVIENDDQYISIDRISEYSLEKNNESKSSSKNVLRAKKFGFTSKNSDFSKLFKDLDIGSLHSANEGERENGTSAELVITKKEHEPINIDSIKQILDNKNPKKVNKADFLVIHDAGNAFRHQASIKEIWQTQEIRKGIDTIFLKLFAPINKYEQSEFWKNNLEDKVDNLIIITTMQDLRLCGAHISEGLSWEKLVQDFIIQIKHNPDLSILKKCRCAIIRIGFEGALIYFHNEEKILIIYNYKSVEGLFEEENPGYILANTSIVSAIITESIISERIKDLDNQQLTPQTFEKLKNVLLKSIPDAFAVLKELHYRGYTLPLKHLDPSISMVPVLQDLYASPKIEKDPLESLGKINNGETKTKLKSRELFAKLEIDLENFKNSTEDNLKSSKWTIIGQAKTKSYGSIAYQYVKSGIMSLDNNNIPDFPVYEMGELMTVDQTEIESFQNVRKLMKEYLNNDSLKNPLSIAVFGPPGSGKSFAIKELIKSLGRTHIEEYNLSQFSSIDELYRVFQQIRDYSFKKEVPLVFFDEFDSFLGSDELGWLKYFIMPMQDGQFFDKVESRPIGRAIFIFGGGVYFEYEKFSELLEGENKKKFASKKVPDFISRLRGHINICGCNPVDKNDEIFKIRRAFLLRSLLKKNAPHLFSDRDVLRIDQDVLRALIKIDRYHHGNRSMQAIIEMSNLRHSSKFECSALPSENQLNMHVNKQEFSNLLMRDIHFEEIKPDIHSIILDIRKVGGGGNLKREEFFDFIEQLKPESCSLKKFIEEFINTIPAIFYGINYSLIKERPKVNNILNFCKENSDDFNFKMEVESRIKTCKSIKQNIMDRQHLDKQDQSIALAFYTLDTAKEIFSDIEKDKIVNNLIELKNILLLKGFELYPT